MKIYNENTGQKQSTSTKAKYNEDEAGKTVV